MPPNPPPDRQPTPVVWSKYCFKPANLRPISSPESQLRLSRDRSIAGPESQRRPASIRWFSTAEGDSAGIAAMAWRFDIDPCSRGSSLPRHQRRFRGEVVSAALAAAGAHPQAETVEVEVDHGRRIEREQLAEDQPAYNRDAEGAAQLATVAEADREWKRAEQGRTGGHHDGAESQQTGLVDRLLRREALAALGVEREINHHDGVFLDQADEQDHADQPHDAELGLEEHQRQHRADAG